MNILTRIVESMNQPAPAWVRPWETDVNAYPNTVEAIASAEMILDAYYKREKITFIEKEQNQSFYAPAADTIVLPSKKQFRSTFAYYATKAHETIHSTGEYTRCNRAVFDEFKSFQFGDSRYSQEELVAELGACFLLQELEISTSCAEHNATAYIHHWIDKLSNNPKWIYKAGQLASEAVEYIMETAGAESWNW